MANTTRFSLNGSARKNKIGIYQPSPDVMGKAILQVDTLKRLVYNYTRLMNNYKQGEENGF